MWKKKGLVVVVLILFVLIISLVCEAGEPSEAKITSEPAVRKTGPRRKTRDIKRIIQEERPLDEDKLDDTVVKDYDDDAIDYSYDPNVKASLICALGAIFSIYTLVIEQMKWDPRSFQRFSVATKIPVEVFCISGPLVLVSAIIYVIMAGLLFMGGSPTSTFFISSSWSAIMIDMSFVCYSSPFTEILTNKVDLILHIVNVITIYNSFNQLRFFPFTFVVCGLTFWGVVVALRLLRKFRAGENVNIFRPGSP